MVHNPEVTGSTPVGGISFMCFTEAHKVHKGASPTHTSLPFSDRQAGRKTEHSQSHNSGVAQRQSIYNIVGRILRPCIKVRKTDGYRLISGRSQDRNLSPEYLTHSCALQKRTRCTKAPHPHPHPLTLPFSDRQAGRKTEHSRYRRGAEEARLKTSSVASFVLA